jgi:hypothetical protein
MGRLPFENAGRTLLLHLFTGDLGEYRVTPLKEFASDRGSDCQPAFPCAAVVLIRLWTKVVSSRTGLFTGFPVLTAVVGSSGTRRSQMRQSDGVAPPVCRFLPLVDSSRRRKNRIDICRRYAGADPHSSHPRFCSVLPLKAWAAARQINVGCVALGLPAGTMQLSSAVKNHVDEQENPSLAFHKQG